MPERISRTGPSRVQPMAEISGATPGPGKGSLKSAAVLGAMAGTLSTGGMLLAAASTRSHQTHATSTATAPPPASLGTESISDLLNFLVNGIIGVASANESNLTSRMNDLCNVLKALEGRIGEGAMTAQLAQLPSGALQTLYVLGMCAFANGPHDTSFLSHFPQSFQDAFRNDQKECDDYATELFGKTTVADTNFQNMKGPLGQALALQFGGIAYNVFDKINQARGQQFVQGNNQAISPNADYFLIDLGMGPLNKLASVLPQAARAASLDQNFAQIVKDYLPPLPSNLQNLQDGPNGKKISPINFPSCVPPSDVCNNQCWGQLATTLAMLSSATGAVAGPSDSTSNLGYLSGLTPRWESPPGSGQYVDTPLLSLLTAANPGSNPFGSALQAQLADLHNGINNLQLTNPKAPPDTLSVGSFVQQISQGSPTALADLAQAIKLTFEEVTPQTIGVAPNTQTIYVSSTAATNLRNAWTQLSTIATNAGSQMESKEQTATSTASSESNQWYALATSFLTTTQQIFSSILSGFKSS